MVKPILFLTALVAFVSAGGDEIDGEGAKFLQCGSVKDRYRTSCCGQTSATPVSMFEYSNTTCDMATFTAYGTYANVSTARNIALAGFVVQGLTKKTGMDVSSFYTQILQYTNDVFNVAQGGKYSKDGAFLVFGMSMQFIEAAMMAQNGGARRLGEDDEEDPPPPLQESEGDGDFQIVTLRSGDLFVRLEDIFFQIVSLNYVMESLTATLFASPSQTPIFAGLMSSLPVTVNVFNTTGSCVIADVPFTAATAAMMAAQAAAAAAAAAAR
jgi:hypothetical protein